ncbi:hypothetical protein KIPB_006791, partial [Kipferlia bialata]|eukprot:g6791.t1
MSEAAERYQRLYASYEALHTRNSQLDSRLASGMGLLSDK